MFRRVVLEEGVKEGAPYQRDSLGLEVRYVLTRHLARLLGNQCPRLIRRVRGAEKLVDGAEIDRHGVHDTIDRGPHTVHVSGEIGEAIDVVPDPLI